jgi:hypothetical protein
MRPVVAMNGAAGIDILDWQVKSIDDTLVNLIPNYINNQDIIALNSGNAFYAYYTNTGSVLKIITPEGDTIITVDPMFTHSIDGIKLALLPNGNVMVLFEEFSSEDVWMGIFDERGNTVLSEKELLDYQVSMDYSAHLVVLPNGNLFFTYVNWVSGYDCFVIFDQQGSIIKIETVFSTYDDWYSLPAVLLNNGNIMIGVSKGGNATQYIIYDSNGDLVKALTDQDDDFWWEMILLDNGNVGILGQDGSNGILSIVSPNGDSIKTVNIPYTSAMHPLILLPNGDIMIVCRNSSDAHKGYYVIYDKDANIVKSSTKFADHYVGTPLAAILSDGDVAIVYKAASSFQVAKLAILEGTGVNIKGDLEVDGLIISGSTSMTSVSTGASDNDKMITQGHMDDAIEAATGAIVYTTQYKTTNYTVLSGDEVVIFTDTGAAKDTCWLPDLYSGKGVWIRRGDNTNDVVITANDLTTDGSTNITNYNMTGTVNSVFCVQESTQWNIVQIGN